MRTNPLLVVLVVAGLAVAVARPAHAQDTPATTIAGGYSYLREQGPGGFPAVSYPVGWLVAGSQPLGLGRLAAAGELGVSRRENVVGETQRLLAVLGGVTVGLVTTGRTTIFGQALVGLERFSEPGLTESGLAVQPGAGLDWALSPRYFLRVQGDYRMSRQTGGTFNELRFAVGGGIRIGS